MTSARACCIISDLKDQLAACQSALAECEEGGGSGAVAPTVTTPPSITGGTTVGSVLTLASPGVFTGTPAPVVTGAWFQDGVNTGITTPTLTTAAAGSYAWVSTATNSAGHVNSPSNFIAVVGVTFTYRRPDGTSRYKRPDGTSNYNRP